MSQYGLSIDRSIPIRCWLVSVPYQLIFYTLYNFLQVYIKEHIVSQQDFRDWESSSQIDPLIFRLLQKKHENQQTVAGLSKKHKVRRLGIMYATYLGIGALMVVILLGAFRGIDTDEILVRSVRMLIVFFGIGFVTGKIAEMCVQESAKSMLHEMLRRTELNQTESTFDAQAGKSQL